MMNHATLVICGAEITWHLPVTVTPGSENLHTMPDSQNCAVFGVVVNSECSILKHALKSQRVKH